MPRPRAFSLPTNRWCARGPSWHFYWSRSVVVPLPRHEPGCIRARHARIDGWSRRRKSTCVAESKYDTQPAWWLMAYAPRCVSHLARFAPVGSVGVRALPVSATAQGLCIFRDAAITGWRIVLGDAYAVGRELALL